MDKPINVIEYLKQKLLAGEITIQQAKAVYKILNGEKLKQVVAKPKASSNDFKLYNAIKITNNK